MARKYLRLKALTLILLCVLCMVPFFLLFIVSVKMIKVPKNDREILLEEISRYISSENQIATHEGLACRVPLLDVNASEILELLSPAPKVVCNETKDWVKIEGSVAKITSWAKNKYGDIECSFIDIIRETDHKQHQGMVTASSTEFNLENSDVVQVYCISEKGVIWQKFLTGIRSDQNIFDRNSWSKVPIDSMHLNVLMFGFDSLSHNMWKRQLPKTYRYATLNMKGIALNGYNIVGDGTPQALIPILTGRTELELPDTRKRKAEKAQYVNVYPFIWNDYQKNGFVTAWGEDMANVGTFTYRLKGFKEQPVDHYLRTFYIAASPFFQSERKYCYGEESRFKIMINFIRNMYEVYKDRPKFVFTFHAEYSHESNDYVVNADEETRDWLQDFHRKGLFNDTLLILMSDHGSRFAKVRNTQQGKQEERLPGFIFVFPPWFEKKYPEAYSNFLLNAERLTTPFDIHETLKSVLHFKGAGKGDLSKRGISLFQEIPLSRTCADAGIEPHWCSCLEWKKISETDSTLEKASAHFINFLNRLTANHRNLCSELHLDKILWSAKLLPNKFMLKFKKSSDSDGLVGDMSDHTAIITEIYQLKVSVNPGKMIFEASVRYNTRDKRFLISEMEVSRINKYKDMTRCIENADILHHLRKYCYCVV